jgi:hypothetical protein
MIEYSIPAHTLKDEKSQSGGAKNNVQSKKKQRRAVSVKQEVQI